MFLGSSIYKVGVDDNVVKFLKSNIDKIRIIYNFSTAALIKSTYKKMIKITSRLNIKLGSEEFHFEVDLNHFIKIDQMKMI